MSRVRFKVGAFIFPLLAMLTSHAMAVVIYQESIHGDLPNMPVPFDPEAFPEIVLPEGESQVEGGILLPGEPDDTEDWVEIIVPAGTKLPKFEFIIPSSSVSLPSIDLVIYDLARETLDLKWTGDVTGVGNPTKPLETPSENGDPPLGDLGPGIYGIRMKAFDDPPYIITFDLVAVPEPSTYVMALFGLLGLLAYRRLC